VTKCHGDQIGDLILAHSEFSGIENPGYEFPLNGFTLAGARCGVRSRNEGTESRSALSYAKVLELTVCAMNRVGIDRDLGHDVAQGWQLVSFSQKACNKGLSDLVD
jgi:hypothetical protein